MQRPKCGCTIPSCSGKVATGTKTSASPMMVGVMNRSDATMKSSFFMASNQRWGTEVPQAYRLVEWIQANFNG